jgi:DNA-binding NarL/FixJ family response regulator
VRTAPDDIGEALHLSVKTVSTHKSRILEKLQLANTAALIRYGLEHQLDKTSDFSPAPPAR